ncbi:MAG: metallophosphoesterase [Saprospiraceae bacterium]|nr:metallophosphoesterase [Saprospiraceae bacterium]
MGTSGFLFFFHIDGIAQEDGFSIGVIADCQFCSDPGEGIRKYAQSQTKLSACVKHFNDSNLDFVIHLGDFIDRDFASFQVVKPIYDSLIMPRYHVLGNHDFSVDPEKKEEIPSLLGIPSRFDYFDLKGWRFIILDGNDLSFHAYPESSDKHKKSSRYYEEHLVTSPKWNGAIGAEQVNWLKQLLVDADQLQLNVMLYCHFPVFPENVHNLWNAGEVASVIRDHPCVKAYVNGHNHEGNYGTDEGIHYLTLKGMVDTHDTSYAIFDIRHQSIVVKGFGREIDRVLKLR